MTYIDGFPVGVQKGEKFYLHNHVRINLKYRTNPDKYLGYRIVGFEVEPFSMHQAVQESFTVSSQPVVRMVMQHPSLKGSLTWMHMMSSPLPMMSHGSIVKFDGPRGLTIT